LKVYLKGKRKNYGNSNISPCKNIIFKKNPLNKKKKPKKSFKNPHVEIDLVLLPRAKTQLSY
jgi:hypothetical protein